ncbi:Survival protein SurA precursor (Peptidyl-prolyl cis-trans isomerase SurA) [Fulvivirga imtechensis AK7]|uniref:Survival protein SurA (Peptidyl-prolyl cis-trans isomerase SurA) n=1 Tax=Fulvivirga imtechensis AK7 TaxID=1237149 RepID=L8JQ71_9BACT|nr:peptidylprolyl isomerase [Fulvivirga imtechensis]ELR70995.1 Survival protein SurA precursor (Peptidyl-prolyl cis-trans isomerase SurA) [Fulvivirga imtechensis AK7]
MKHQLFLALLLLAACKAPSDISGTGKKNNNQPKELLNVAGEPVPTDEFIYVYKKNNVNNDSAFTRQDINEYLDLYINFKLKVAEAKKRGMDTTEAFYREFSTYREQLKKPYLTENLVTEKLIKEAYERYKTEVNASHILIAVDEKASAEDTLKAYNKIVDIRKRALEGTDFAELAAEYSDDPSARSNGGNLGYFTSFQMVYPFESAAYDTDKGAISQPVRTRFGYHLVKVLDKRPSQGSAEVSHIMIRIQSNKSDSLAARNKIFEIYDQANGGVNWDDLARQFSEDINTKNAGGKLRPFKVGQMPYSFQEAAFNLEEPGDISDPVMTPYGWHIIRLEKKIPLESFEEMEPSIKSRIDRDSRAQLNRKFLISRLKKENSFKETAFKNQLWSYADSSLIRGSWKYSTENNVLNEPLFLIGERTYTVKDFFTYVQSKQKPASYGPEVYMQVLYNNFIEDTIISYEEDHLEDKYIDYKMLVKEYKEGILLFELMEREVWNKAVQDTVGLKQYFDDNLAKYVWDQRVSAIVYNSDNNTVLADIEQLINSGDSLYLSKKDLERKYNNKTALTLQVEEGLFERGDHPVIDKIKWEQGIQRINWNGRYNLVLIREVLPASSKELNEIRGLVISDYQNHLEKQWVEKLKEKYTVEVNKEGLNYIYDQLEK